jgi:hypothetical protein
MRAMRGLTTSPSRDARARDLVRDRLAAAGGHEHDRVAAGDDLIDDRGLIAAEVVVAEDVFEDGARVLARTVTSEAGASRCGGGSVGGWCRGRRTRQRSGVSVELGRRGASYSSGGVSSSTSHGTSA